MYVYRRLESQILIEKPKTITVDVFDTILLRKNKSEKWHFWKYSKLASQILKDNQLVCTPLTYFSMRNYYTQLLRSANLERGKEYEVSLDSLNEKIIVKLLKLNSTKLSKNEIKNLCTSLAESELLYECNELKLNKQLIELLTNTKQAKYFITDMYFSSEQIVRLLELLNVKLTSDGISSADHLAGKSNGKSFIYLQQKFPNIKSRSNLHIGDHKHADIVAAKDLGMMTFWLNLPFHRLRLLLSKYTYGVWLKLHFTLSLKKANSSFKKDVKSGLKSTNLERRAKSIGKLFGMGIIYYCDYFSNVAVISKKQPIFVSSESVVLNDICKQLGYSGHKILPKLGRKKLLQCYVYLQHRNGISYWECMNLVTKVQRRKSIFDALITLEITDSKDKTFHLMGKNAYKEYLENKSSKIDQKLKKVFVSTLKQIKHAGIHRDLSKVLIGDVGWNNTIQILLSEILKNTGGSGELSGLYMGVTGTNVFSNNITTKSSGVLFDSLEGTSIYLYQPEVWESFLNTDNIVSPIRKLILDGIAESVEYINASELSPADMYLVNRNLLIKLLANPNKKIIQIFSQLKFDYGTGIDTLVPMVNINYPKYFAYRLLLRDRPRFKQFYYNNGWKWGAASWYHFRLIYRLWRKIKRKPSF